MTIHALLALLVIIVAAAMAACLVIGIMLLLADRPDGLGPPAPHLSSHDAPPGLVMPLADVFDDIRPPNVLEQSELFLADNVRTLRKDARTTRKAIADAFEKFAREVPLM